MDPPAHEEEAAVSLVKVGSTKWAVQNWVVITGAGPSISAFQPEWPPLTQVDINITAKNNSGTVGILLWGWVCKHVTFFSSSILSHSLVRIAPSLEINFSKAKPILTSLHFFEKCLPSAYSEKLALYKMKLMLRRLAILVLWKTGLFQIFNKILNLGDILQDL